MATYYIDGAVGDDSNAGTSEGAGNAWKTIGKAKSHPITAGDTVYVKASATYNEQNQFATSPGINGTISNPIVMEGYKTTPGDGFASGNDGRAAITDPTSSGLTGLRGGDFWSIRNFKVTGGSGGGSVGIGGEEFSVIENCEVIGSVNSTQRGISIKADGQVVGCYVHGCATAGIRLEAAAGVFSCITDTCVVGVQNVVKTYGYFYCIARGNTNTGLIMNSNGASELMVNCTVDGTGAGKGISQGTSGDLSTIINCVVTRCATGIEMSASASSARNWSFNNCLFDNTNPYSGGGSTASGEITTDPKFVDKSAKDYGPDTGSPLIMAGFDFRIQSWLSMTGDAIDVGALQSLPGVSNFAGAFLNWGVN